MLETAIGLGVAVLLVFLLLRCVAGAALRVLRGIAAVLVVAFLVVLVLVVSG